MVLFWIGISVFFFSGSLFCLEWIRALSGLYLIWMVIGVWGVRKEGWVFVCCVVIAVLGDYVIKLF